MSRDDGLYRVPAVEYEIYLSPIYRVPVLYLRLMHVPDTDCMDLPSLYRWLVPLLFKEQLQDVGVLGAISIANHPASQVPTNFVHPCNTSEAMEQALPLAKHSSVKPEAYLILWMGIVGGSVGLEVPLAMVSETVCSPE
ncbi:hypothetical protein M501DRAFT_926015 [Patellaria atrata CBS 101060]|uniref:Ubiquitin-like-conjugating enzyme ATG10 n=1 Tax=Patellaria atrata CBS 101060 TaxID=1346257 RepID=A0A9P4VRJ0_9PEZI|nr:hypothetical protein M501DRAFT_926015 [Patellaria atrata CBS 101060]